MKHLKSLVTHNAQDGNRYYKGYYIDSLTGQIKITAIQQAKNSWPSNRNGWIGISYSGYCEVLDPSKKKF